MSQNWFWRKKTLVNKQIQGRILGRIAAYWVLYHFVLWNGLFVFRYAQYRAAITSGAEAVPFREHYSQFCHDFYPLVVCAAVILPAFMIDFVKLTHRIAGPLIRFQEALRQMRAGERVESVGLRKHDLLTELQNEFNEFLEYYNARLDAADAAQIANDEEASEAERLSDGAAAGIGELVAADQDSDSEAATVEEAEAVAAMDGSSHL